MRKNLMNQIIVIVMVLFLSTLLFSCKEDIDTVPVEVKYNVIFDVNAGDDLVNNEPDTIRVLSGSNATKPNPDPVRSGYDFSGWYLSSSGDGEAYLFNTPVTSNVVLYAKWSVTIVYHSVTLDYSGGGTNSTMQVASGETIDAPAEPNREGYLFEGWFISDTFSSQYNFANSVTSDFTIYAKWIQIFTVTFDFNYDGSPSDVSQNIEKDDIAEEPETPDRIDYTFAGWFTDSNLTTPYEFTPVTANLTLYAKWIDNSVSTMFTVEFNYDYDGAPDNVVRTIADGAIVNQPATARTNYRFLGWYLDQGTYLNRFFTSTTPVTSDLVLYANYVRTYQLSIDYNYQGVINPNTRVVDENVAITNIQEPSRLGYTFAGWSDEPNGLIGFNVDSGISVDTTIYAQWTKTNVFEAEYLDFSDFFGWGFSGNATGTDAILEDLNGDALASNGRFVTYLYGNGITLTFEIYSDRAIDNVSLTLRLSGEIKDFYIQSMKTDGVLEPEPVYTVKVNDETINYSNIYFIDVPSQSSNELLPFYDYTISINVSLVEGKNEIKMITDNELVMGGTMSATAPMVDCIKLSTYAILTWTPVLDNY